MSSSSRTIRRSATCTAGFWSSKAQSATRSWKRRAQIDDLAACDRVTPDCIVDYRLPDVSGLALLPALRAKTDAAIIFITAHPEPLTMTKAYRHGALTYLSKDFLSSETFQAAVVEALRL